MYTRIAEFQSTSRVNCDMIIAFFQNVMIPRNIKNGQLSCEVFRVSDTTGFVISCFKKYKFIVGFLFIFFQTEHLNSSSTSVSNSFAE